MWIEKYRIKKDRAETVMSFELSCFMNTEFKNRLKSGAVPSLFLENGN